MLKKLIKFSASYTVIDGLQRGILFLLLPIYTHYMTPVEYGIVSTSLILISFLSILFSLAIHASISRYYHKYEKETQKLKEFLGSNFLFITLVSFLVSIILILFGKPIFTFFFEEISFNPYIIYTLIIVATQVIIVSYFSLLKAMQNLKLYIIVFNIYYISQLLLMSLLIIEYNLKQDGYLLGVLISNIVFIPIIFILLHKHIVYKINFRYIKETLNYSLPIVPANILSSINRLIDRYYILLFIGLNGVGVYYIGVQIAGLINLVALAINSAYTPIFFKKYENTQDNDYKDIYNLADSIVFFIGIVASFTIILFPILLNLFDKAYQDSNIIILYLGFTGALSSIYFLNVNALSIKPKLIKLKTIGFLFGTVINIILGYFFTKFYGIEGAAISTLIGYFITTLVFIFLVSKYTNFNFNNNKYIIYYILLFTIIYSIQSLNIYIELITLTIFIVVAYFILFNKKK